MEYPTISVGAAIGKEVVDTQQKGVRFTAWLPPDLARQDYANTIKQSFY